MRWTCPLGRDLSCDDFEEARESSCWSCCWNSGWDRVKCDLRDTRNRRMTASARCLAAGRCRVDFAFRVQDLAPNPAEAMERAELFSIVVKSVDALRERERDVVQSYFGIGCDRESICEIAKKKHVTSQCVWQILAKGIRILRYQSLIGKLFGRDWSDGTSLWVSSVIIASRCRISEKTLLCAAKKGLLKKRKGTVLGEWLLNRVDVENFARHNAEKRHFQFARTWDGEAIGYYARHVDEMAKETRRRVRECWSYVDVQKKSVADKRILDQWKREIRARRFCGSVRINEEVMA